MRRLLLILVALGSLGVGEGLGQWTPPEAPSTFPAGWTSAAASGSTTCGLEDAYERGVTAGRGTRILLPATSCNMTEPFQIDETNGLTIEGATTGQISVANSGSRLVADFDAIELQGTNDTIDVDLDTISSSTADYNGIQVNETGVAANESKLVLLSAGANTINWLTAPNAFEVGQCLRADQFDEGGVGIFDDDGGPYCITSFTATNYANDTAVVSDPKNRLVATTVGAGGVNERVHGVVIEATAGLANGDWGAIENLNGVPFFVRFKTTGANTTPFGASDDNNGRAWPIIQQVSATKITVDDPNEFAVSQAGLVTDWVASPPMIFIGESYHGADTCGQPRNITFKNFSLFGDGDGDGDGDAFAAIVEQPDADHSCTFSLFRRDNINMIHFGDGDGTVSGTDFTYLDTAVFVQGVQSNDTGPTGTNDQDDQLLVTHERIWDVGRGYYTNSKQAVLMNYIDVGVTDAAYRAFELETGSASIQEWSSTHDDRTDDLDDLFYVHSTAHEFRLRGGRAEGGAGTFITTETSYPGVVYAEGFEFFIQDQDREDFINHQGTGTLELIGNSFNRQDDTWEADIEAPNALRIDETGSVCHNAAGAAISCADGGVIENRNYGVLPDNGECFVYAQIVSMAAVDVFLAKPKKAINVFSIDTICPGAASLPVVVQECDATGGACGTTEASITCDADGQGHSGAIDDALIDAGDWINLDFGVGAPTSVTVEVCTF